MCHPVFDQLSQHIPSTNCDSRWVFKNWISQPRRKIVLFCFFCFKALPTLLRISVFSLNPISVFILSLRRLRIFPLFFFSYSLRFVWRTGSCFLFSLWNLCQALTLSGFLSLYFLTASRLICFTLSSFSYSAFLEILCGCLLNKRARSLTSGHWLYFCLRSFSFSLFSVRSAYNRFFSLTSGRALYSDIHFFFHSLWSMAKDYTIPEDTTIFY